MKAPYDVTPDELIPLLSERLSIAGGGVIVIKTTIPIHSSIIAKRILWLGWYIDLLESSTN